MYVCPHLNDLFPDLISYQRFVATIPFLLLNQFCLWLMKIELKDNKQLEPEVIYKEYGNKKLDLVEIFSNTEIINKLFEEQVIMIVWGINPYSYPIYSADNPDILKPLVGEEFDHEGIFKIREDIKELSLIPGHNLGDWPALLKEDSKHTSNLIH